MNVAVRFVAGRDGLSWPARHGMDKAEKYPGAAIVKLARTGLRALKLVIARSIVTPMAERMGFICLPRLVEPTENSKERD